MISLHSDVFGIVGLSYDTNETVLKDAFGQHGEIIEGNIDIIKAVKISEEVVFLMVKYFFHGNTALFSSS